MKTIGLLGGMSWESTVTYYQLVNQGIKERLGGLHSAKCLLWSADFHEIEACQAAGEWEKSGDILLDAARRLEGAGADFLLLCTNTMHKVAPQLQAGLSIPLLHIAKVTARALLERGIHRVALLGTRYTMEQDFYRGALAEAGLEVLVPGPDRRAEIDRIIFRELCLGEILPPSKALFLKTVEELASAGAQGTILGCTEIGLLIGQDDTAQPLFDTTRLHAAAAVELALAP